jgi:hypothetical protein
MCVFLMLHLCEVREGVGGDITGATCPPGHTQTIFESVDGAAELGPLDKPVGVCVRRVQALHAHPRVKVRPGSPHIQG